MNIQIMNIQIMNKQVRLSKGRSLVGGEGKLRVLKRMNRVNALFLPL
jgi:hypothetical protein